MLHGHLMGGVPVATGEGLPIVETEPPECPEGYELDQSWEETGGQIVQVWAVVPSEGTPEAAGYANRSRTSASHRNGTWTEFPKLLHNLS